MIAPPPLLSLGSRTKSVKKQGSLSLNCLPASRFRQAREVTRPPREKKEPVTRPNRLGDVSPRCCRYSKYSESVAEDAESSTPATSLHVGMVDGLARRERLRGKAAATHALDPVTDPVVGIESRPCHILPSSILDSQGYESPCPRCGRHVRGSGEQHR